MARAEWRSEYFVLESHEDEVPSIMRIFLFVFMPILAIIIGVVDFLIEQLACV